MKQNNVPEEEPGVPVGEAVGEVATQLENHGEKNYFKYTYKYYLKTEVQILFLIYFFCFLIFGRKVLLDLLTITTTNRGSLDIACIGECQSLSSIYVNPK